MFKNDYKYEPYLDHVKNVQYRKDLTRFRISAHNLNIERGRYANLNIEDRTCKFCRNVEDEKHLLMICAEYNNTRQTFFDKLNKITPNIAQLDCDSYFLYILSTEDEECLRLVGNLVSKLFAERCTKMLQICVQ
jgi:hypothetical protein